MNHQPIIQPVSNRTARAGDTITFNIFANDVDQESSTLQYSFVGSSHGATLSPTGQFSWTPSWDTATESTFTFRVSATDAGAPQLRGSREFTIQVSPISPSGLRILNPNGTDTKVAIWDAVSGATEYLVERRISDGEWTQIANTSSTLYSDPAWPLTQVEYRVRAYNSADQLTPFSAPVREYFSEMSMISGIPDVSRVSNGVQVKWNPFLDLEDSAAAPPVTEYIVQRIQTSAEGWIQVFRAPVASIPTVNGQFSFIDQTATPGTYYEYGVIAVTEDFNAHRTSPLYALEPQPSIFTVDFTFNRDGFFGALPYNPPQLLDVADAEEESVGYFIPINDNFDEANLDVDGSPLRDNEPDATANDRIKTWPYQDQSDRQLTTISLVDRNGYDPNTLATFTFPTAIKLWGQNSLTEQAVEIVSGTTYHLWQIPFFYLHIEGIEESQAVGDVELKVAVAPGQNPAALQVDKIRLTVGNLRADVLSDIDAETAQIMAYVPIAPYTTQYDGEMATFTRRHDFVSRAHTEDHVAPLQVYELPALDSYQQFFDVTLRTEQCDPSKYENLVRMTRETHALSSRHAWTTWHVAKSEAALRGNGECDLCISAGLRKEGYFCGVNLFRPSPAIDDLLQRAALYQHAVAEIGLADMIAVFMVGGVLRIKAQEPWKLSYPSAKSDGGDPSGFCVAGFTDIDKAICGGERLVQQFAKRVLGVSFVAKLLGEVYNSVFCTLNTLGKYWNVDVMGAFRPEAADVLKGGDISCDTPSRIPAFEWHGARGWAAYGSVVVKDGRRFLEIATDAVASERLREQISFLEDLKFKAVYPQLPAE